MKVIARAEYRFISQNVCETLITLFIKHVPCGGHSVCLEHVMVARSSVALVALLI